MKTRGYTYKAKSNMTFSEAWKIKQASKTVEQRQAEIDELEALRAKYFNTTKDEDINEKT